MLHLCDGENIFPVVKYAIFVEFTECKREASGIFLTIYCPIFAFWESHAEYGNTFG